jgi:biotin transporter BioY
MTGNPNKKQRRRKMFLISLIVMILIVYAMGKMRLMLPAAVVLGIILIYLLPVIIPIVGVIALIVTGVIVARMGEEIVRNSVKTE